MTKSSWVDKEYTEMLSSFAVETVIFKKLRLIVLKYHSIPARETRYAKQLVETGSNSTQFLCWWSEFEVD